MRTYFDTTPTEAYLRKTVDRYVWECHAALGFSHPAPTFTFCYHLAQLWLDGELNQKYRHAYPHLHALYQVDHTNRNVLEHIRTYYRKPA